MYSLVLTILYDQLDIRECARSIVTVVLDRFPIFAVLCVPAVCRHFGQPVLKVLGEREIVREFFRSRVVVERPRLPGVRSFCPFEGRKKAWQSQ